MNVEREIEFFDQFERDQGDYDVLGPRAYRRLLDFFQKRAGLTAQSRIADLGCGSGAFTRRLAERFPCAVTGMDISPRLIQRAQSLATREQYVVGNIMETGLPDGSFDAVVYSGVLHHLTTPEVRHQALREGLRLLRPGGCLFAYDPSHHSPSMRLYRHPRSPLCSKEGKTDNEVLLRRDELAVELRGAGFVDVEVRGLSGITYRYVAGRIARRILPLYNLYEVLLQWSPLENRLGTFLATFAKRAG